MFISATTRHQVSIYSIGPYWYLLASTPTVGKVGYTKIFFASGASESCFVLVPPTLKSVAPPCAVKKLHTHLRPCLQGRSPCTLATNWSFADVTQYDGSVAFADWLHLIVDSFVKLTLCWRRWGWCWSWPVCWRRCFCEFYWQLMLELLPWTIMRVSASSWSPSFWK